MESYKIQNLSFEYPNAGKKALCDINITITQGEFVTLCGKSGCGKTTLLRLLKPAIAPFGSTKGKIFFNERPLEQYSDMEQTAKIGYVMQNPDNQIVTDKVWHELAFGLESMGYQTAEIRARVSEMASFFGIGAWFHKKVTELSGGQKQLLNLASVMAMQPSVLILDEPTGQLDPIAAQEFLKMLQKINRELGITVILSEHRLEEAFPISDRVIVMDSGRIIAEDTPKRVGEILKSENYGMYAALPVPMRIGSTVDDSFPLTVRDGRQWLEEYAQNHALNAEAVPKAKAAVEAETVIEVKNAWFRYEKSLPDVIKDLNLEIKKGELFAVLGGNGAGKTSALSLISGLNTPYRGQVRINGRKLSEIHNLYGGVLGVLPQNPQALFVKKTVYLDLLEILSEKKLSKTEKEQKVLEMAKLCRISDLLESHPYDLSGGEQQRAALAKVLLQSPEILLLDEPTKGMDALFKAEFAGILQRLKSDGVTIVMVSHDIEFCAEFADRCALFFDGNAASTGEPRSFFAGKSFYTTAANRMARTTLPEAVLASDIILACGKTIKTDECKNITAFKQEKAEETPKPKKNDKKMTPRRKILGSVFVLLTMLAILLEKIKWNVMLLPIAGKTGIDVSTIVTTACVIGAFVCFFPQKELGTEFKANSVHSRKITKRTFVSALLVLVLIPLTIYSGWYFLEDRKYYFISLLVIAEILVPFCMLFENRRPQAREIIVISVMCAIAVLGRSAFAMLPQFKPVTAIVIIAGVCFGGEAGFLVGAVTGFVSNFFFGQGPWTPWQMFSFGIIGFLSGILFRKGLLRKTRLLLCIYGGLATVLLYGGIMNPASVLMGTAKPTAEMIATAYALGLPLDLIHGASTVFFLWFIAEPMMEKIERVKIKYGLINR